MATKLTADAIAAKHHLPTMSDYKGILANGSNVISGYADVRENRDLLLNALSAIVIYNTVEKPKDAVNDAIDAVIVDLDKQIKEKDNAIANTERDAAAQDAKVKREKNRAVDNGANYKKELVDKRQADHLAEVKKLDEQLDNVSKKSKSDAARQKNDYIWNIKKFDILPSFNIFELYAGIFGFLMNHFIITLIVMGVIGFKKSFMFIAGSALGFFVLYVLWIIIRCIYFVFRTIFHSISYSVRTVQRQNATVAEKGSICAQINELEHAFSENEEADMQEIQKQVDAYVESDRQKKEQTVQSYQEVANMFKRNLAAERKKVKSDRKRLAAIQKAKADAKRRHFGESELADWLIAENTEYSQKQRKFEELRIYSEQFISLIQKKYQTLFALKMLIDIVYEERALTWADALHQVDSELNTRAIQEQIQKNSKLFTAQLSAVHNEIKNTAAVINLSNKAVEEQIDSLYSDIGFARRALADAENELSNTQNALRRANSEVDEYQKKYNDACFEISHLQYENGVLRDERDDLWYENQRYR